MPHDKPRPAPDSGMLPGQSVRTAGGECRIKYDPEWSPTRPYCTYVNNGGRGGASAEQHRGTLREAAAYLGVPLSRFGKPY